jgi:ABC-2 type transport system ATP-binding protein
MDNIIQTENLTKHYREVNAVNSVDLQVNKGEIYGFLGLNGAGKTTTIRMLLGMIKPTRGKAWLFGKQVDPGNLNLWNRVGQLVEIPYSYPELTVEENLEIFRRLRFIKNKRAVEEIMDKLMLTRYRNIKTKNLSLGNAQRLGIAKAMFHNPDLLILDEPANGLDPSGIVQIRELLLDLSLNHGITIFISSHILGEISKLATRIGIIHNGKMIREAGVEDLQSSRKRNLHINTLDNKRAGELLKIEGYTGIEAKNGIIEIQDETAMEYPEKISSFLSGKGLPPRRISVEEEDLEHYFFRIIKNHNVKS